MIRQLRVGVLGLFVVGLLGLVIGPVVNAAPTKDEVAKAVAAIEDIVKTGMEKGAAAASKTTTCEAIMLQFKPKDKGGIGYGEKGEAIESKIMNMAKKGPTEAVLKKEGDDLIKLAKQSAAIAAINDFYVPKAAPMKSPKDWVKYNGEMKKAAGDLIEAVKAGKGDDVKKASNSLNSSCVNCHGIFRDS